ncbi:MAG: sensor histidine kinase [Lachnospiraceae bacterium]|nr:sensor histidine kinase [Lachnospiraceae bacterium]
MEFFSLLSVIAIVLSIILSSFSYFSSNKYFTLVSSGIYIIVSLVFSGFTIMFPLILYNSAAFPGWHMFAVLTASVVSLISNIHETGYWLCCIIFLGIVFACYIQYIQYKLNRLIFQFNKTRDDSTEHAILLESRNRSLLEKQDYEIYNATLKERNRIAREIHDNVGHLLSRSILLTGAIKAVNKDDNCKEPLNNLHEALDQAMTSIRESVHNLHNESVNLKESIEKIINNFNFCNINFTYDIGTEIPREIKLSFISIVKEGLNNIYKHSNATDASILLREHPAMYQLVIKDNGTTAKNTDAREYMLESISNSGIGINNISSRVSLLNGSLQIHTNNGFCIFITIPKT